MLSKISQFLHEYTVWRKSGRPTRSKKEIEQIFAICEKCEHYKQHTVDNGSCKECGCNLSRSPQKGLEPPNKIEWGTTKCPVDKWGTEEKLSVTALDYEISELELQNEQPPAQKQQVKKGCGCNKKR